jgi:hypothetical protein
VCGRAVQAANTEDGIRAVRGKEPVEPEGVEEYLEGKFGDDLAVVRAYSTWRSSIG